MYPDDLFREFDRMFAELSLPITSHARRGSFNPNADVYVTDGGSHHHRARRAGGRGPREYQARRRRPESLPGGRPRKRRPRLRTKCCKRRSSTATSSRRSSCRTAVGGRAGARRVPRRHVDDKTAASARPRASCRSTGSRSAWSCGAKRRWLINRKRPARDGSDSRPSSRSCRCKTRCCSRTPSCRSRSRSSTASSWSKTRCKTGNPVGVVALKDRDASPPGPEDVYTVGTVAIIQKMIKVPDGTLALHHLGHGAVQDRRIHPSAAVPRRARSSNWKRSRSRATS